MTGEGAQAGRRGPASGRCSCPQQDSRKSVLGSRVPRPAVHSKAARSVSLCAGNSLSRVEHGKGGPHTERQDVCPGFCDPNPGGVKRSRRWPERSGDGNLMLRQWKLGRRARPWALGAASTAA